MEIARLIAPWGHFGISYDTQTTTVMILNILTRDDVCEERKQFIPLIW